MNPKSSKYTYVLVLAGIVAAVSLIIFFVGIMPLVKRDLSLHQELSGKRNELASLNQKKGQLDKLADKLPDLQEKEKVAVAALPQDTDKPQLFREIESLASGHNLSVQGISEIAGAGGSSAGVSEIDFSTSVVGSYSDFKDFLDAVNNALRLVSVTPLNVSVSNGNQISVGLVIKSYYKGLE